MNGARPTVGLIGAGLMGQWHATTVRRLKGRVVAVVDADIDRANTCGSRFGALAFPTVEAMLEHVRPQVVHICTPLPTHLGYAKQLLAAGCHVVCEKPLADNAADVAELLESSRSAGRLLCPVHQFASQAGVLQVADRLHELGDLRRISFTFASAGGQHLRGNALDDVVLDIAPHPLSVLARLLPTKNMDAIVWQCVRPTAGELMAIGACGEIALSLSFSMSTRPTEATAVVCGTHGTAHIDFFHGYSCVTRGSVSRLDKALRPLAMAATQFTTATLNLARRGVRGEFAYPGLRALLAQFYASIDANADPPFSAAETLSTYRTRDVLAQQLFALR